VGSDGVGILVDPAEPLSSLDHFRQAFLRSNLFGQSGPFAQRALGYPRVLAIGAGGEILQNSRNSIESPSAPSTLILNARKSFGSLDSPLERE
jgi:hypothetical protein